MRHTALSCRHGSAFPTTARRGVALLWVAVTIVLMVSLAALSIDVGHMYMAQAELRVAADAAATAAAADLGGLGNDTTESEIIALANDYASRNLVLGEGPSVVASDVVFGRAILNELGQYEFVPNQEPYDAVRITVRRTADHMNGPIPLLFARIFGLQNTEIEATATAMMVPRDIAVVVDTSASMNDDSEIRHYLMTEVNLFDVWDTLPPGLSGGGGVADDQGPTWGYMDTYGDDINEPGYDPRNDPGLIYLRIGRDWNNAQLISRLQEAGYNDDEIDALTDGAYDWYYSKDPYRARLAVCLGLARWNSGWGTWRWDEIVRTSELTWLVDYPYVGNNTSTQWWAASWYNYFDYVRSNWSQMYKTDWRFRHRFGLKTFVNYLLEARPRYTYSPVFMDTPVQPFQAVKDAVRRAMEVISGLQSDDQVSLVFYGSTGNYGLPLSSDYMALADFLDEHQPAHFTPGNTNIGHGIHLGMRELLYGSNARESAAKVIFLLTDGNANIFPPDPPTEEEEENDPDWMNVQWAFDWNSGREFALERAQKATQKNIRIYTVSVGADADQALMEEIAIMGHGEHFHAEGDVEEYSSQLEEIFEQLGGKRPVLLIE